MKRQAGFTILEMAVGVAIMVLVSIAMAGTFLVGYQTLTTEARVIAADTAVNEASLVLVHDLESTNALVAGTIGAGSTITMTYGSPAVTVVYSVDANKNLIRTGNGNAQTAARGITSVTITVAGCYATASIQPSATGASASTLNVSNRRGGCF